MTADSRPDPQAAPYEQAVIEAAQDFVGTTSYWQQQLVSRDAFEKLAVALLDLEAASRMADPFEGTGPTPEEEAMGDHVDA